MDSKEAHKRLMAAYFLLMEETTTREKFNHISTMIRGIHKDVDVVLDKSHQALSSIEKIRDGDIIHLSAEHLPENTEEERNRKKYLLLFIRSWKDLKTEINRVSVEFKNPDTQSGAEQASMWGRILRGARGPLGVITVVAVGIVALQQTSVQVTIENQGCATMYPGGSYAVSVPGLKIPKDPIPSGGTAVMTIPPLTLYVDGTQAGSLSLSALKYSFTFELPGNVDDVALDGESLLGKATEVHLSEKDSHTLRIQCG